MGAFLQHILKKGGSGVYALTVSGAMFVSRTVGGVKIPCCVFYIIVVLVIFAYGALIRQTGTPDVLERMVIDDPSVSNFDGWAATHLLFWTFLGFWFPGHYLQALGFSLAWEGFEDFLGRTKITMGGSRLQLVGGTDEDGGLTGDDQYWYGRYTTDTAYNLIGYILGSALAARFWPPEDK